jgi:hypothetical protein
MLTIYGCVRQGTQVACDTDFNNQNQYNTQVTNGWWRDAYLVDQFGDRHARASAYFVNGAGQPRESIDIPYGQSARYIMIFNDIPANAATASLHSPYGPIDVENMALDGSSTSVADNSGGQAAQGSSAGNAAGSAASGAAQNAENTGKQAASQAADKANKKANDSLQNLMNKIPH